MSQNPKYDLEKITRDYNASNEEASFFETNKTKIAAVGGSLLVAASNASAALTAPDFTGASADVTTVVVAIIGFVVVIFGFRKVLGLLGK
ncbi:MAG: hypothetical protein FP820_04885 [Sulfurimonas sp.]|nr:hypothetical protein [Sulfurimonas sp.]MBU3940001.1 hypothetical protein [bacterium]MBU4023990.1 hypothetical protein [bacterium]MBU4058586.1 hypothetical protein [bacterium]